LRRTTFVVMGTSALAALLLLFGLTGDAAYALSTGGPEDIGELRALEPERIGANVWVRGSGTLSTADAVRYRRPLDPNGYRLARVEGSRLWVELRVPLDADGDRFIPPASFVGRLVPAADAGLRYGAVPEAVEETGRAPLPPDAWLLIDGESPAGTRWVLGVVALLAAFAAFNTFGLIRLAHRVRT